ncbi:amine oxidase [Tenacibaculum holothuriorum]|uniref:Tryptophan 2-monooxygenase n=1 Tax=Tenacibaculum holothuriorum TaxID=1635173 RepID=A0A1Y2PBH2_9FLAO|nr:amine oxidase [Tenacibaculum holothuriorum]
MGLLASCKPNKTSQSIKTNKKVIVIGAGVAGLSASKYLKDKRIDVIVLEAQEKIGGRLKTDRSLGISFDEGASWIHGPEGNPITEIAKKSGAKTYLTSDDKVEVFDTDEKSYSEEKLASAEEKFMEVLSDFNGKKDKSFGEVFYKGFPQYKNDKLWTYMLSAFLEFDSGGDIYKLSSKDFYDDETFDGEDIIITNGYDKVADYLAKGIDVKLNTKVTEVNYDAEKVKIKTSKGNFEADYVLITVPLGVLKNKIISFRPELPIKTQKAINSIDMGSVNKFLLVWETAFWDENLQYIGYTPETRGKFNYFMNVKKFANANALMTFTFGDYSIKAEQMSDNEIIEEIMNHLRVIYGKDIPKPIKMLRTKWNTNPYTFGSYSFATNGVRTKEYEVFEEPIDDKLFFAGEHTIREYRGTVHGAYLSGIREAKKITEIIQK